MLSHHPFFEHLFKSITVVLSVMCLSLRYNYDTLIFDIFISSLHLNFRGALAFMFCPSNKGNRDTTLSYLFTNIAILVDRYMLCYSFLVHWYLFMICITTRCHYLHGSYYELPKFDHIVSMYTSYQANVFVKFSFIALSC